MHHSLYAIRLLAEQRSAELIAEAQRLNQLQAVRHRRRRKHLRSFLARLHLLAPGRTVIDLREPPPPEPDADPAKVTVAPAEESAATDTAVRS